MRAITTIGLDIAKSVFQVHGIDADGCVVIRRRLKRRYVLTFFEKLAPCLIGIEACASSHHWARQLQSLGHTVRLIPPAYVKPYVKRQKNDAPDAEAICEAVTRANMRFVATKTPEQQSGLVLHRTRHLFIRQQTVPMSIAASFISTQATTSMPSLTSTKLPSLILRTPRRSTAAALPSAKTVTRLAATPIWRRPRPSIRT
jgi:transposase